VARVREIVELAAQALPHLRTAGNPRTKGVLLYGPPGTGKTLLARAVAAESRVHFIHLNGPEIMRKFYGESEAKLRDVFEEARATRRPSSSSTRSAVAPKRAEVAGEARSASWRSFLSLMDGFVSRGQVVSSGPRTSRRSGSGAQTTRTLRSRDRDRRPEHPSPASDSQDPLARHAARAGRRPSGDRRNHSTASSRNLESVVPGIGMIALRRFLHRSGCLARDPARENRTSRLMNRPISERCR